MLFSNSLCALTTYTNMSFPLKHSIKWSRSIPKIQNMIDAI